MSEKNPLVSIVTTCFNMQNYIAEAIKSVAIQTYPFWEMVIVDDFSADKSIKVISKTIKKLKIEDKVKVIRHEKNRGCGKSLRDAIENSSGELVAILDGDDVLSTSKSLKLMVKAHMKHSEAALIYSNYTICNPNLKPIKVYKTRQLEKGRTYLGTKIRISHLKVFKRKFYDMTEGVNPELRQTIDKDLVLKLEEVGKLVYLDANLYCYREHSKNLTKSFKKKSKDYRKSVSKMRHKIYEETRKRRGLPEKKKKQ